MTEDEKPIEPSKAEFLKGLLDTLGTGVDPMAMLLEALEAKPITFTLSVRAKDGSIYLKVDKQ